MKTTAETSGKLIQTGDIYAIARCVRGVYIGGCDPYDHRNYDHRRQWIDDRLRQLQPIFAVTVYAMGVHEQELHLVLRVDPEQIARLSDGEIVARETLLHWPKNWSLAKLMDRQACWQRDHQRIAALRQRLGSLSGFMAALRQPIARRGNRETGHSGYFWEPRIWRRQLLNPSAVERAVAVVRRVAEGEPIPLQTRAQQRAALD